ncbi:MAG: DUF2249 domain-containing protein, partial [Pseudomonadota bacterium]
MSDVAINVCNLEPPEPMVRILDALSVLKTGERLAVTIDREPIPLYRVLHNHAFDFDMESLPD